MSTPSGARGGAIALRGFVVQTLVALLDLAKPDSTFTEITLEPLQVGNDKFDYIWKDQQGTHAVQVKSTEGVFMPADVKRWAAEMMAVRTNEACTLLLVGRSHPGITASLTPGVSLQLKNLDIPGLLNEAAQGIGMLRHIAELPPQPAPENLKAAKALVLELELYSIQQRTLDRAGLIGLLSQWAIRTPPQELKVDLSRIVKYAPAELIGRETETALLNDAWAKVIREEKSRLHVLTFVALGGEGKTSLVAKWAADLAAQDWPGCEAVFAWSFYSQGTHEQAAVSSDLFLAEAITFFGDDADKVFASSPAGAFEKGQRLARLVGHRRSLLILDGLEPLQHPSSATAFHSGELKDQGVAKLLKDLAANNAGLCIVTSRIGLPELKAFKDRTAREIELKRLSREAGVDLLRRLGVKGSDRPTIALKDGDERSEKVSEFEKLVEDVKGHALTLTLLGGFLKRAFLGDIRQRDRVKFEKADEKMDGGHAFRTMAAYEQWLLRDGGDEGRREVAVLRLMGLFDRPADAGCLAPLRRETILGLTEPLAGLADDDWEYCLSGLETAKLLTVNRDTAGALVSLDAHPHLREYFARQLRTQQPDAWRAAHRRLYEHLCGTAQEGDQPTLEELQPLYQAIRHGCLAENHQSTFEEVYIKRIQKNGFYSVDTLGALDSDLKALSCFFDVPWRTVSPKLSHAARAQLLNRAGFRLNALGLLHDAEDLFQSALKIGIQRMDLKSLPSTASNLSETKASLGNLKSALVLAVQSVIYADMSDVSLDRIGRRSILGGVLHQVGERADAMAVFKDAEAINSIMDPACQHLSGFPGFRYCELLLEPAEKVAWQRTMLQKQINNFQKTEGETETVATLNPKHHLPFYSSQELEQVKLRIQSMLRWIATPRSIASTAITRLAVGRIALYKSVLLRGSAMATDAELNAGQQINKNCEMDLKLRDQALEFIESAVSGLRKSNMQDQIPQGLLTRAWFRGIFGKLTGAESAQVDLDEAWDLAVRGSMVLFRIEVHLYRARIFGKVGSGIRSELSEAAQENSYPWRSPKFDLSEARELIRKHHYFRRLDELNDAERILLV